MKERPILFSAPMVRALLAGTKTQTRRAVANVDPDGTVWRSRHRMEGVRPLTDEPPEILDWCPYGQIGERLWVRERFGYVPTICENEERVFAADYTDGGDIAAGVRYKSSIHMPRAASRILLEVTDVRVQRLQSISEADAIAEGLMQTATGSWLPGPCDHPEWAYHQLWDQINGAGSWDANPFVWAVSFRVLKGPQP